MENASKALLIAGAILIAILLIGIGMLVYHSAMGTIDSGISQMGEQEKMMFNQQFDKDAGTRINGSRVKALLQTIRNNNTTNAGTAKVIKVNYAGSAVADANMANTISSVVTAGSYKVVVSDTDSDGLVDTVDITYNKSGT